MNPIKTTETLRIYWQQWVPSASMGQAMSPSAGSSTSGGGLGSNTGGAASASTNTIKKSRRELLTSSAAVRISSSGARAQDVTDLLRASSVIPPDCTDRESKEDSRWNGREHRDVLILVGTLYSLPQGFVRFEHETSSSPVTVVTATCSMTAANGSTAIITTPTTTSASLSGEGVAVGEADTNGTVNTPVKIAPTYSARSDPFHVVRTLQPNDDPILIRQRMEEYLTRLSPKTPTSRTVIAPKLQWYYIPTTTIDNSQTIANCLELDGYCSSLEEDDSTTATTTSANDDDDDDDGTASTGLHRQATMGDCHHDSLPDRDFRTLDYNHLYPHHMNNENTLSFTFPWLGGTGQSSIPDESPGTGIVGQATTTTISTTKTTSRRSLADRRFHRYVQETRHAQELANALAIMPSHQCYSGYLLKRSQNDPHVWRRSYCVLTEDYLWCVSRMYTNKEGYQYAKHTRIRLTRALVLEPSPEYDIATYRIPYAFELVTQKGTSYLFRAPNRELQLHWIQTISHRIVESFENSLIDHADLIIADECLARNRRLTQLAVRPFWQALHVEVQKQQQSSKHNQQQKQHENEQQSQTTATPTTTNSDYAGKEDHDQSLNRVQIMPPIHCVASKGPLGDILRWGMQVATYRERCRYVQSLLPAKNPVVVGASTPNNIVAATTTPQSTCSLPQPPAEPIDIAVQRMIQSVWMRGTELLARASHISQQICGRRPSRGLETHCRHIDYILFGRFRDVSYPSLPEQIQQQQQRDMPPPIDLFDPLLQEIQNTGAVSLLSSSTSKIHGSIANGEKREYKTM